MPNIFISGSMAYDDIMVFPHHFKDYFHPEKLHQINVSFVVNEMAKHLGGVATNISYALRNTVDYLENSSVISTEVEKSQSLRSLDSKRIAKAARDDRNNICPVGAVGRDGGDLLTFFKNNSIDTTYVIKDEKLYTATGKVITDMNDNQIWGFYYGACAIKTTNYELSTKNSQDFWILSATHEKPFTSTLRHVMKHKLPYLFDPGMTLTWIRDDLLKKGVMNATFVIGNDYEISMIEKRLKMTVAEIVKSGVNVLVTLGEKGVKLVESVKSVEPVKLAEPKLRETVVKAVRLRKVVDPTGAGDAWRGGFVGALLAGQPIRECLVMGNVMASFAVETMGTVEYKASAKEIERRTKTLNSKP